jgi:predicted nucleotidyltransferase
LLSQDYKEMLSAFNDEKVDYMIVGAYAVAAHGVVRATGDIDLWIRSSPDNAKRAWCALANFGAPLSGLQEADLAVQGAVFQIGVAPSRIDILTSIDGVEFSDAWNDRIEVEVEGIRVNVIGRSHLIANKKAVGRPQDLADVARLESEKA